MKIYIRTANELVKVDIYSIIK